MKKKSVFLILFFIFSATVFGQQMFFHLLGQQSLPEFTWTGGGADAKWTTVENWSTRTVPGASDTAHFMGAEACSTNCSVSIDTNINIKGLDIRSTYAGVITQGAYTISLGSDGWSQAGGTFTGGNGNISLSGPLNLTGGTLTSTSGIWTQNGSTYATSVAATYNHNSGTLKFISNTSISVANENYFNVTFDSYSATFIVVGTMNVLGTLTLTDNYGQSGTISGGTFNVKGNVIASQFGYQGSALVKLTGSGNQTVTGGASALLPAFEVASTGGTVSYVGTLNFTSHYTWTSGSVATGTSSVRFVCGATTTYITPGTFNYNNVEFSSYHGFVEMPGTMTVNGSLTMKDSYGSGGTLNSGTIVAKGDFTSDLNGYNGSGLIKINGSTNQLIAGIPTAAIPNFEIASTGGTVSLVGTLAFRGGYTYTSGTVAAGTSTLDFFTYSNMQIVPGTPTYYNVNFTTTSGIFDLNSGTLIVGGTLALSNSYGTGSGKINSGTILARGDTTVADFGMGGSVNLRINGSTNQTITGVASATYPRLEIASTGGTVNYAGVIKLLGNYLYTSGSVNAGSSTLVFGYSSTLTPGSIVHNNVSFVGNNSSYTLNGTLTVNGDFSGSDIHSNGTQIAGGAIVVNGNISLTDYGVWGSVTLTMAGTGASALTIGPTAQRPGGLITINKTGSGSVTLASNAAFTASGQNLTVNSGLLDLSGYTLNVANNLAVNFDGTLRCNGGTYTNTSLTNNGTIDCAGYAYNWTGATGNGNWNSSGNWSGGMVPTSSDSVVFNDTYCGSKCAANINSNAQMKAISITNYSNTITQGSGVTITVGSNGWKQDSGTFNGSNAAITFNGPFKQTGGTFVSTSGTLFARSNYASTGTFTHNSGTVSFQPSCCGMATLQSTNSLNHFTLNGSNAFYYIVGTVPVAGNLILNDTYSSGAGKLAGGTIEVAGNLTVNQMGGYGGDALIKMVGASPTITGTANQYFGSLEIAVSGTASFVGEIGLSRNFKISSGALSPGTSTLRFTSVESIPRSIDIGTANFYNLYFDVYNSRIDLTGTANVSNVLELKDGYAMNTSSRIVGGVINAAGDVNITYWPNWDSTFQLNIVGTGTQNITGVAGHYVGAMTIASSGTVNLIGTIGMSGNYNYTSGTLNAGTSTLDFVTQAGSPRTITPGNINYYNASFNGNCGEHILSGTMQLAGSLSLSDGNGGQCGFLTGGTYEVSGDVTNSYYGKRGTSLIKLSGSGNQTITGVSSAAFPSFEIASTGGTVSLAGTLRVSGSYMQTSGIVNAGTSQIIFAEAYGQTNVLVPGTVEYNDVWFAGGNTTMSLTGTMIINGTLKLAGGNSSTRINGGTLLANGNVLYDVFGSDGTAALTLGGITATTLNSLGGGARLSGAVTVAKTGSGSVTFASNNNFMSAGQTLTVSSGVLNLAGYTTAVNSALTVSSGATLLCNGGSYTSGSLSNSGTIDCANYGFNWTGAGADSNWSTAGNWSGGMTPGVSDPVVFKDAYCGVKCDATIDSSISVKGIAMLGAYAGTITQASGNTISVGEGGWSQAAGTFTGGTSAILVGGNFDLSGGTFTSTSATLTFGNSTSANFGASATFYANGGTVVEAVNGAANAISFAGTKNFNNYLVTSTCAGVVTQTGAVTVNGTMSATTNCVASLNGGSINVKGDVTSMGEGVNGTTVLNINGSTSQSIAGSLSGAALPDIIIASTGGTVTMTDRIDSGSFTYLSGTLNATSSTIYFSDTNRVLTFTPGSQNYGSVSWNGGCQSGFAVSGTLNVLGLLTLAGGCPAEISGGTIIAKADITYAGNGAAGTVKLIAAGSTNQAITGSANAFSPSFELASTGGTVTFTNTIEFVAGFTYTSGVGDLSASHVIFGEFNNPNLVTPGNLIFNDVNWNSDCRWLLSLVGTMRINGLTSTSTSNCAVPLASGKLQMYGDADFSKADPAGGVQLEFAGSASTTLKSGYSGMPSGNIQVTKTGGAKLTLTTDVVLSGASQSLTLTSGEIDLAGFNLSTNSLALNGNTLSRNGGTLTVNGAPVAAGTQSVYGGTVAP